MYEKCFLLKESINIFFSKIYLTTKESGTRTCEISSEGGFINLSNIEVKES